MPEGLGGMTVEHEVSTQASLLLDMNKRGPEKKGNVQPDELFFLKMLASPTQLSNLKTYFPV